MDSCLVCPKNILHMYSILSRVSVIYIVVNNNTYKQLFCVIFVVNPHLILGCIPNQPLGVSEADIGRGRSVPLVVGNDLHLDWRR